MLTEGAWLTVLVIPLLMYAFVRVNRHYRSVAAQRSSRPSRSPPSPRRAAPIAVVAMQSWNKLTVRGLQFAVRFAPEVYAVQVKSETAKMRDLTDDWERLVAGPVRSAGLTMPKLVVLKGLELPPVLQAAHRLRDRAARPGRPGRDVVVVIPDLVVAHWYQGVLHNNRGTILRTLLRLRGGEHVIVLNTRCSRCTTDLIRRAGDECCP